MAKLIGALFIALTFAGPVSAINCYNGTTYDGSFPRFIIVGCIACTKTESSYRVSGEPFFATTWSGLGCGEETNKATEILSDRYAEEASDCGFANVFANDAIRANLINRTYTCRDLLSISASASYEKLTWKNSCICCTSLCNDERFDCSDLTISNFKPKPMLTGQAKFIDMLAKIASSDGELSAGLSCYSGKSNDDTFPGSIVKNCEACTKSTVSYSFLGINSTYTEWGGHGCTSTSVMDRVPDYSNDCFIATFRKALSTRLTQRADADPNVYRSTRDTAYCIPDVFYTLGHDRVELGDRSMITTSCTCCDNLCNNANWICGDNKTPLIVS